MGSDLKLAWRLCARHWTRTLFSVLSLSVAFGFASAIYCVVDAVLLRPFPFASPSELVLMWGADRTDIRPGISGPLLESYRQIRAFASVAGFLPASVAIPQHSDSLPALLVEPEFFDVLGVRPVRGRTLTAEDSVQSARVAVVSSLLWQQLGSGSGERSLVVNGETFSVVGVMPERFFFPDYDTVAWLPLPTSFKGLHDASTPLLQAVGRLREGSSIEQARTLLHGLALATDGTAARLSLSASASTGVFSLYSIVISKYQHGLIALVLAAVGVLVLACLNVGHLQLAAGEGRRRDFATRLALGATRTQVLRLMVVEAALLSFMAGIASLFVTALALWLLSTQHLVDVPGLATVSFGGGTAVVALLIASISCVVTGVWPSIRSSRHLSDVLKGGESGTATRGSRRLSELLVVTETALTVVLSITALAAVAGFVKLGRSSWGFEPSNLTVIDLVLPDRTARKPVLQQEVAAEIVRQVQLLPGVSDVAWGQSVPVRYFAWQPTRVTSGRGNASAIRAGKWTVGAGYFLAMGVPLLAGREFTAEDLAGPRSVVINESLAKLLWPRSSPIGETLRFVEADRGEPLPPAIRQIIEDMHGSVAAWEGLKAEPRTVVGVVGDMRMFALNLSPAPAAYQSYDQPEFSVIDTRPRRLLVRITPLAQSPTDGIRGVLAKVDPGVTVRGVFSMDDVIGRSIGGRGSPRLLATVTAVFGGLAVFLTVVGTYGMVSYAASQRRKEIGIRMVLGASPGRIQRMMVWSAFHLTASGAILGASAYAICAGIIRSYVPELEPKSLEVVLLGSVAVIALGGVAGWLPSQQASRLNPAVIVRGD